MKPLSVRRRRVYFIFFSIVFILVIPILLLYASGYRLGDALDLIRTGGLFVSTPYSGVNVRIGENLNKETSVFQKNVFVQNLRPGRYEIAVSKEGYNSWSKSLTVFPQRVTEAYPFLIPQEPNFVEIKSSLATNKENGTTTRAFKAEENPLFTEVVKAFATTTKVGTTSDTVKIKRKLSIENRKGTIFAFWNGDKDSIPTYFCVGETCKNIIKVETDSRVRSFDFFPGRDDVLILALADMIAVVEIDDRSSQNMQTLIKGDNLDFRILSGERIVVRKEGIFFELIF